MQRRSMILGTGAALTVGLSPRARSDAAPLVVGNVSLSFYSVTGAVVIEVLKRLGHAIEVRAGPHEEMFPLLGGASIDLMAAAWLPEGHAIYWAQYGREAVEVTNLYEGAAFFWAVPDYVTPEVASIDDLLRPEVMQRMNRQIQGIGRGAAISIRSMQAITAYGLDERGYTFRSGTQSEWLDAYQSAVSRREWIVFPTWAPQFLNRDGRLRPLRDPRGSLGGLNRAALVAPRSRFEALPGRTRRTLARVSLDLEAVTQMDWDVNVDRRTPEYAAKNWMEANPARVDAWLDWVTGSA